MFASGPVDSADPFKILGLDPSADTGQIRIAYQTGTLETHPDARVQFHRAYQAVRAIRAQKAANRSEWWEPQDTSPFDRSQLATVAYRLRLGQPHCTLEALIAAVDVELYPGAGPLLLQLSILESLSRLADSGAHWSATAAAIMGAVHDARSHATS